MNFFQFNITKQLQTVFKYLLQRYRLVLIKIFSNIFRSPKSQNLLLPNFLFSNINLSIFELNLQFFQIGYMVLSAEAQQNKPKKPMPAYFRYRTEYLADHKDDADRNEKAKQAWNKIDPKLKQQYDNEYKEQMDQYKNDMEAWKAKYKVQPEDLKRKSKKRQDTDDDQDKKPTKTKGHKQAKEEKKKSAEKKKEEPKKGKTPEKDKAKSKKDEKANEKGNEKADKKKK